MITVGPLMEAVRHVLSGIQRGNCEGFMSNIVIIAKYYGIWFSVPVGTYIVFLFLKSWSHMETGAILLL